ncbi:MAG: EpsG family protein [Porticoccaceae bacterium]
MLVYLLLYVLMAGTAFLVRSQRRSWQFACVTGVFLALFIGGRSVVGCDYRAYEARFQWMYPRYVDWWDGFRMGEGGFHLVNLIARDFGWGFHGVVLICGVIYAWCLVRFSRLAPFPMALIAIAFPILIIQLGMSGMRQAIAVAFLMLAYVAFTQRSQWLTAMWVGVAFLFHSSAIILLPIAWLARRQMSLKYLIAALVLLAPIAGWLLGERLEVYNARYVEQIYGESSSGGAWIRYAVAVAPFLLMWWKKKFVEAAFPKLFPLLWLFMLATFALVLVGVVSTVALHRLTYYMFPVSLLALLCVVECAFSRSSRQLAWSIPFLVYGGYILFWFLLSRHGNICYIPYQSWLFP